MKEKSYVVIVGSLNYVQICTSVDLSFVIEYLRKISKWSWLDISKLKKWLYNIFKEPKIKFSHIDEVN